MPRIRPICEDLKLMEIVKKYPRLLKLNNACTPKDNEIWEAVGLEYGAHAPYCKRRWRTLKNYYIDKSSELAKYPVDTFSFLDKFILENPKTNKTTNSDKKHKKTENKKDKKMSETSDRQYDQIYAFQQNNDVLQASVSNIERDPLEVFSPLVIIPNQKQSNTEDADETQNEIGDQQNNFYVLRQNNSNNETYMEPAQFANPIAVSTEQKRSKGGNTVLTQSIIEYILKVKQDETQSNDDLLQSMANIVSETERGPSTSNIEVKSVNQNPISSSTYITNNPLPCITPLNTIQNLNNVVVKNVDHFVDELGSNSIDPIAGLKEEKCDHNLDDIIIKEEYYIDQDEAKLILGEF